jgi:hypothetical protein
MAKLQKSLRREKKSGKGSFCPSDNRVSINRIMEEQRKRAEKIKKGK